MEHDFKLSPLQSTAEKGNSSEDGSASNGSQSVNVLASEMEALDVSSNNDVCGEAPNPVTTGEDVEKRIRALKKKVRFPNGFQSIFFNLQQNCFYLRLMQKSAV